MPRELDSGGGLGMLRDALEGAGVLIPSWLNPKCSQSFPGWEAALKLCVLEGHIEVTDPLNSDMRVGGMKASFLSTGNRVEWALMGICWKVEVRNYI